MAVTLEQLKCIVQKADGERQGLEFIKDAIRAVETDGGDNIPTGEGMFFITTKWSWGFVRDAMLLGLAEMEKRAEARYQAALNEVYELTAPDPADDDD